MLNFSKLFICLFFISCWGIPTVLASTCDQGFGTDVFGPIFQDSTWTKDNSPYCLTQNVTILENVTLTIDPGVVVKFWDGTDQHLNNDYCISVEGLLIARGTGSKRILFTSSRTQPKSGDWGYIEFTDTAVQATFNGSGSYLSGCIIEYAIIEYGGGEDKNTVHAINTPYINNTFIRNNGHRGIYFNKSAKISNSTFSNNKYFSNNISGGGAVYSESELIIDNSIFENNYASPKPAYDQIGGGGALQAKGNLNISNSEFNSNTVRVSDSNAAPAFSGGGAIYAESNITLSDSKFHNNTNRITSGSALGGAIYLKLLQKGEITRSTFTGNTAINLWGSSRGGAIYTEGDLEITDTNFELNSSITLISEGGNSGGGSAYGGAIYSSHAGSYPSLNIVISNSVFKGNSTRAMGNCSSIFGPQESFGGAIAVARAFGNLEINDSLFLDNSVLLKDIWTWPYDNCDMGEAFGGAIYAADTSPLIQISNCSFSNNSISLEGNGSYISPAWGGAIFTAKTISIIDSKFTLNSSDLGAALYSEGALNLSKTLVINNTSQNALNIPSGNINTSTIANNSAVGLFIRSGTANISGSNLFGNSGYDVYNNSIEDILAKGNYWGTTDTANIFSNIFDKWDDSSKGEVDFGLYDNSYLTSFASGAPRLPVGAMPWIPMLLLGN